MVGHRVASPCEFVVELAESHTPVSLKRASCSPGCDIDHCGDFSLKLHWAAGVVDHSLIAGIGAHDGIRLRGGVFRGKGEHVGSW